MDTLDNRLNDLRNVAQQQSSHYASSRQLLHQNIVDAYLWWRDAQQQDGYLNKLYSAKAIRYKKANANKPNFYPLVRLIWDIDVSTKASTISNWAKTLTVLDDAYVADSDKFPQPRADLINFIDAKGGLKGLRGEKQMSAVELEKEEDVGSTASKAGRKKQQGPRSSTVLAQRMENAHKAPALATTQLSNAVTNDEGFLVMLGRRNAQGDVEIISSTYKAEAIVETLWAARAIDRAQVDSALRLIAESIEPHSLPAKLEPFRQKFFMPSSVKITNETADPNIPNKTVKTSSYVKQNTQLRIRPSSQDILVSQIASSASLVTRIKPRNLQLTSTEVVLRGSDRFWIETELLNQQKLDFYTANGVTHLQPTDDTVKADLKLVLDSKEHSHQRNLYFYDTATQDDEIRAQVDIQDTAISNPIFEIAAQTQWLKSFDAQCVDNWLTHTKGLFNKKQMQRVALVANSTELTLKHWWLGTGQGYERAHATLFSGSATSTLHADEPQFECSPKDLAMVFSMLPQMPLTSSQVHITANAHVMKISYSTDIADYETFIPAINDAGEADATAFKIYGGLNG